MAVYGAPRKLNSVSVLLLLATIAGGYWLWRFFPAYWDSWTVDHILSETAHAVYKLNHLNEPERTKTLQELLEKTRADIIKKGNVVEDHDHPLTVNLDFPDENFAVVTAEYEVVVTHPYVHKTTTLHFKKSEKSDIKKVVWE
jgi:hypothetical protein